ncbi:L-rhamnose mutarotase [Reichenbachiella versicolor]|uniref:L-rhamnose mutarotase n=1 Tax=Reichenbachiella versicolor TaxID=1821036 RepID=UPI000D6DF4D0|nr:L-rhamnose mutarotase [Reichenbachiella versicolor]
MDNTHSNFHRFTYFFQSDSTEVKSFFTSEKWKNSRETKTDGVWSLKAYNIENDYFLIIDASSDLNSQQLFAVLEKNAQFGSVQKQLKASGLEVLKHDQALERIYEFNQKHVHSSKEGQLKTDVGDHKRFVWTLLLEQEPELMAEYKRVHSIGMAWPEITNNMKTIGVKDMEIYLYESQAILIMDTIPNFDLEEVGPRWQAMPRESEWQEFVAKFQRTDPNSSIQEKWKTMNEV